MLREKFIGTRYKVDAIHATGLIALRSNTKTKEDYYLWLSLLSKVKTFYGLEKKLVSWRKLDDSLSSSVFQRIKDAFLMYNHLSNKNIFISVFYTLRLSIYALKKKINIYNR